ncbi:MAG: sugar transferase [Actinomycetota bacterium]|nr:sugar transferase [Actinomycetota bacterium]
MGQAPTYERLAALVLATLALPVFVAVAVAILVDSGRPLFRRQRRIGLGEREFEMLKFRSMVPDAEAKLVDLLASTEHDGALFKMRHDPRVTSVGRFIRKYSLDELPQLFNVLRGEMLLVGPRPFLPRETDRFGEAARRRFLARPDTTGLWQVSGRSDIPWEVAVRLDLSSVENWSQLLEAMILFLTLRVVWSGRGGY